MCCGVNVISYLNDSLVKEATNKEIETIFKIKKN